jgi:hypothetical protein
MVTADSWEQCSEGHVQPAYTPTRRVKIRLVGTLSKISLVCPICTYQEQTILRLTHTRGCALSAVTKCKTCVRLVPPSNRSGVGGLPFTSHVSTWATDTGSVEMLVM